MNKLFKNPWYIFLAGTPPNEYKERSGTKCLSNWQLLGLSTLFYLLFPMLVAISHQNYFFASALPYNKYKQRPGTQGVAKFWWKVDNWWACQHHFTYWFQYKFFSHPDKRQESYCLINFIPCCCLLIFFAKMSVLIWIQIVWHSDIVFLKEFFEKVNFEKSQQMTTKAWKITQNAKI